MVLLNECNLLKFTYSYGRECFGNTFRYDESLYCHTLSASVVELFDHTHACPEDQNNESVLKLLNSLNLIKITTTIKQIFK